jgi:SpoIID/LytB domain protein
MTSRTPRILTALATAAIVVAPAAPAGAVTPPPTDPAVTVGGSTTLTVSGDGWGHGHGMSQWGAQGAALQGKSSAEILKFYYPGPTPSALGGGKVKVLITADNDNNLKVKAAQGLKLVDTGRGKTYRLPTDRHQRAWKLKSVHGLTRVYYKTGRWHRYRPGGHSTLTGAGQFKSTSHRVTAKLPSGTEVYRGALRFTQLDTVNVVGMESYLRGVVPAEAFTSWRPAALQAQAVAARTYAAFERAANPGRYFHVYDTTRSQAYHGVAIENANTDAAIAATADRVLRYNGQLAFTQFSASSGGWTSTGSKPYLVAQPDLYDTAASGDTNLNWTRTAPIAKLQTAHPEIGTITSVQIVTRDSNVSYPTPGWDQGWVRTIKLTGTGGTKATLTIDGTEFQSLYGLKSAYFSLSVTAP